MYVSLRRNDDIKVQNVVRYDRNLVEAQNWGVKKGTIIGIFQGYLWCIIFLCYALAFWYGSKLVINTKELSPGSLIQVCKNTLIPYDKLKV